MQYYLVNTNGRIATEIDLKIINDIYGDKGVENLIKMGHVKQIDPPTVVDCLISGNKYLAVKRYREIHEVENLRDAFDMVNEMERDVRNAKKSRGKKSENHSQK